VFGYIPFPVPNIKCHELFSVAAALIYMPTDGRTDMTKVIGAFRDMRTA